MNGYIEEAIRSIAVVLQDTFLFSDTVRENLRYGRLDATDAEVEQAARRAHAHEFILQLGQGDRKPAKAQRHRQHHRRG